jgi:Cysteine-rich CPCC
MRNSVQKAFPMETCVCCGYASLSRGDSSCKICRWEDDGHDNTLAFRYSAGNQTNLNLARYHFLLGDKQTKKSESSFEKTRMFKVDDSGGFIEEFSRTGKCIYRGPIPFVDYERVGKSIVAAVPIRLKK